jgi:predicted anti-sigma-YlaC factor YlaD
VTCRDVHAFLSDWLTGDLPHGTREVFARHLEGCASCRAYLDSYEKTITLARAAGHDEPPPPPWALEEAILEARRRGGRAPSDAERAV